MSGFIVSKVPMLLSRRRTWTGQGRNKQYFDLKAVKTGRIVITLFVLSRPAISVVTTMDPFREMLMQRIEDWADDDERVVTYLLPRVHDWPGSELPEWPRNDALHTQSGNRREHPEFNLHLVLTNEVRSQLSVWLDQLQETEES